MEMTRVAGLRARRCGRPPEGTCEYLRLSPTKCAGVVLNYGCKLGAYTVEPSAPHRYLDLYFRSTAIHIVTNLIPAQLFGTETSAAADDAAVRAGWARGRGSSMAPPRTAADVQEAIITFY
ncbi:hypothetical protein EVAR_20220_1 [Eumeta japonica]|uniref:Uncharacterized protein n=1 Tax=Eumeta variegata TaxID=151549 RepID=A0A4C1W782_EUMVA|nr:hypothetical protein EVAR_20220_1 [Eumeta japonica]